MDFNFFKTPYAPMQHTGNQQLQRQIVKELSFYTKEWSYLSVEAVSY